MKDYRLAGKGEIKCRDCEHGRPASSPREWYRCWFYAGRGPIEKVSKNGTCANAKASLDTQPPAR
jgi:hypothetical protein